VQRSVTVFIDNGSLLKKIQFPRIALPAIVIGTAMVANLALFAVMMVILPVLGIFPSSTLIWLPLLLTMTIALAAGIGLFLGTLNVFARDIGQVVAVLLQFWFWVTPIAYPISIVPEGFKATLAFNPVVPLVTGYQNIFVYGTAPPDGLVGVGVTAIVLIAVALLVFRRASAEMVDAL
jgi:lipopolysaccharide transport system permease protein